VKKNLCHSGADERGARQTRVLCLSFTNELCVREAAGACIGKAVVRRTADENILVRWWDADRIRDFARVSIARMRRWTSFWQQRRRFVKKRNAKVIRNTAETQILLALTIDGPASRKVSTGIPFFDHMLMLLAKHSLCDLTVTANGDDDVDAHPHRRRCRIALGQAFVQALGDKRGIRRYGWALVPMDETLAQARIALDFSNRPFLVFEAKNWSRVANVSLGRKKEFRVGLVKEFLQGFANEARCNLHVDVLRGDEPHHVVESIFKSAGKGARSGLSTRPAC